MNKWMFAAVNKGQGGGWNMHCIIHIIYCTRYAFSCYLGCIHEMCVTFEVPDRKKGRQKVVSGVFFWFVSLHNLAL